MYMKNILIVAVAIFSVNAIADYPSSFANAKKKAEQEVYFDRSSTFYCGCDFVFDDVDDKDQDGNLHETMIYPESCGYEPRNPITKKGKDNARVSRIEWEHIVPAHVIGGHLPQWKDPKNFPECHKSNGKYLTGRKCAYKSNSAFKRGHDDLNNLVPAVGELNGDRSNYSFAIIEGEKRTYGQCNFEVDFKVKTTEPPENVRGNIARTYFHMAKEHAAKIDDTSLKLFKEWDKLDPIDEWECTRNQRIIDAQGLGNSFVTKVCQQLDKH